MNSADYFEILKVALPESLLVLTALAAMLVDFLAVRDQSVGLRMGVVSAVGSVGCAFAIVILLLGHGVVEVGDGMLVSDPLGRLVKVALLALAIPTLILSAHGTSTDHAGEYVALVLFAVIGMMFLVSAQDLLMIFVALEMTSLSLYILAAFNKRCERSAEAALKYFLFGGVSAALTLFGFSLLYGLTGATYLPDVAAGLAGKTTDPLLLVALVGVVGGFGFKVAAVPFHLWAPDAYEGAPTPSAALIATGSKVASFFILARIVMIGLPDAAGSAAWQEALSGWGLALGFVAALSMVLGNLAALAQSSVKRLLAYSAIAHAGYALLGIIANDSVGVGALLYYVITYGTATLGAFGVVSVVEKQTGGDRLQDFAGLFQRSPALALCMFVFMLSLAGIPPLAGFFGKFYVFVAAAGSAGGQLGLFWLVVLGVGMSVVSLYYYLQVLKRVFVVPPGELEHCTAVPWAAGLVVVTLCIAVILLGCFPGWLVDPISAAITAGAH